MEDSILNSVKLSLGIASDYTYFDDQLIMHINTAFAVLNQLGVGPKDGYQISGPDDSWSDYTKSNKQLNMMKTYMYAKVRLIFDPPQSSAVKECLNETVKEYESRIRYETEIRGAYYQ